MTNPNFLLALCFGLLVALIIIFEDWIADKLYKIDKKIRNFFK